MENDEWQERRTEPVNERDTMKNSRKTNVKSNPSDIEAKEKKEQQEQEKILAAKYLIELIRSVLEERKPQPKPEQISMKCLFLTAKKHNLACMAYDAAKQIASEEDKEVMEAWQNYNRTCMIMSAVQGKEGERLLERFSDNQVRVLPLKVDKAIFDDIVLKVKGTMFHKIGAYVVYGTDNVLLSKFFGLLIVGIYSNYSLIITSVTNVFAQIVTSATASVGDLLTYNDITKNFRIYKELQLFNAFVINMTATCLLCLISPFVSMFFGKEYILSNYIVVVLIINYCLMGMRKVYGVFKDAAGIQYEDRFVPIIEAISNIVFSLIFIKLFGVVGVFLGTTCSYFCIYAYTFPILIYKGLLHKKYIDYVMELLKYFGTFVVSMSISYTLSNMIVLNSSFMKFIISGVICLIVPNMLFILIFGRTPEFESLKNRILRLLRIS